MNERLFHATVPAVASAVAWAREAADEAGLPPARGMDLELAVEEALMNVSLHAYRGAGGEVRVRAGAADGLFVVEIEDSGPSFDPGTLPPPDTTAALADRPIGGLGVHLIRRVTDGMRWRREEGRNVLTLLFAPGGGKGASGGGAGV